MVDQKAHLLTTEVVVLGSRELLPGENAGPLLARSPNFFFNEKPEVQFLYEIS